MRFSLSVLALAAAFVAAAFSVAQLTGSAAALQEAVTVNLGPATGPDGGGDQSGTASLTAMDGQTQVVVDIDPSPDGADVEQPAHIHSGNCDNLPGSLGAVEFPLENVVNGSSTTVVDVGLDTLQSGDFAVNVHKSADEIGVYTSCGNIPAAAAGDATGLPESGGVPPSDGGLSLTAYLLIGAGVLALAGGSGLVLAHRRR